MHRECLFCPDKRGGEGQKKEQVKPEKNDLQRKFLRESFVLLFVEVESQCCVEYGRDDKVNYGAVETEMLDKSDCERKHDDVEKVKKIDEQFFKRRTMWCNLAFEPFYR